MSEGYTYLLCESSIWMQFQSTQCNFKVDPHVGPPPSRLHVRGMFSTYNSHSCVAIACVSFVVYASTAS